MQSNKLLFIVLVALAAAQPALAAFDEYPNLINCNTIAECLALLGNYIVKLAFPVAVLFIIWSGFLFATAGGSEQKISQARKTFTWAIIGLAVVIGAWALATAFQNFFTNPPSS